MIVSLLARSKLAEDSGSTRTRRLGAASTSAYAVDGIAAVDQICARRTPLRRNHHAPTGRQAVRVLRRLRRPGRHTWEVAFIEALTLHDDGTVAIPS